MQESIVRFENISMQFPGVLANDNVSFDIKKGEVIVIIGPSGCGKSTMLSLMAALDAPQEGEIRFGGTLLKDIKTAQYRRNCVTTIFQKFNLLPYATVIENVMYPQLLNGAKATDARKAAEECLSKVDIGEKFHARLPKNLSGGEQQRVAIARALAAGAKVILADEPTGNLDEDNSRRVVELLARLAREEGRTVIMVTHDGELARKADVMFSLRGGKLLEIG